MKMKKYKTPNMEIFISFSPIFLKATFMIVLLTITSVCRFNSLLSTLRYIFLSQTEINMAEYIEAFTSAFGHIFKN